MAADSERKPHPVRAYRGVLPRPGNLRFLSRAGNLLAAEEIAALLGTSVVVHVLWLRW